MSLERVPVRVNSRDAPAASLTRVDAAEMMRASRSADAADQGRHRALDEVRSVTASSAADLRPFRAAAGAARSMGWAPYTGAVVLAAVRTTRGEYYGGANVEVANISLSKHAEESAVLAALAAGALTAPDGSKEPRCIEAVYTTMTPCGSCRQLLHEFATEDCVVYVESGSDDAAAYRLSDLLPHAFGPADQLGASGAAAEAVR
jgi:cytidine deaminase